MLDKVFKRAELLFSAYEPAELYLGFAVIAIILAAIVLLNSRIYFRQKKEWRFDLLAIPSLCALMPAVFSLLVLASGKINLAVSLAALGISFVLNYWFVYFNCRDTADYPTYLCAGAPFVEVGQGRRVLYWGLLLVPLFYLFSIDHNWVPPQYDITSYQFIGELFFRKRVYPVLPFAGQNTITIFVPPGYFIFDFIARLFWNDPRAGLLVAVIFFLAVSIAFVRLGSLIFKTARIEPFMLMALFARGLFWNFWEFNLLRAIALVCSLMFVCALIRFHGAATFNKSLVQVIFAQIFLSSAILSHPEQCAYLLAGVILFALVFFGFRLIKQDGLEKIKARVFFASLIIPAVMFGYWYFSVVRRYSSADYFFGVSSAPIPFIDGLLFHCSGFLPILFTLAAVVLLVRSKYKNYGFLLGFLFVFTLFLSYFQGIMGILMPDKFHIMDGKVTDHFASARFWVATHLVNPDARICKISGFWWYGIIAMGWVFYYLWGAIKEKAARLCVMAVIASLLLCDVFFMYYNQPIITRAGYSFLKSLGPMLPEDAVIIAPPGYEFSVWTGPVLRRDSLSNRAATHSANSLSRDLNTDIERAYMTADFSGLLARLPAGKVFVLVNADNSALLPQFQDSGRWRLFYVKDGNYAFQYAGS